MRDKRGREILRECLIEAWNIDDELLEEELKNSKPHIFSKEFEAKMEELLRVKNDE